ncbi:MAG: DUF4358 domain-containing protein [Clostridiales bacterium]|nr:DUF4358 domain-containing protein [Clostridiales bacterium]
MKKFFCTVIACMLLLSLAGCGGGAKTADLSAAMKSIESAVTFGDMMDLTQEDLQAYYGIDAKDVKQFAVKISPTGINCDEVALIEGVDEAASKRIEEKLQAHYQNQCNSFQDYLPEQYAILEKCSVKRDGNFVSLIVSENAETIQKTYEAAFK